MRYKQFYLARRNPALSEEEWPRAWRSHAIYASQFSAAVTRIDAVSYCPRIYQPTLDGAAFDPPGVSRDYDGVAVVGSGSADAFLGARPGISDAELQAVTGLNAQDRALLEADELRVFDRHVPEFSFLGEESLALGGAAGRAAVIRFLPVRAGQSREAFLRDLGGDYADVARQVMAATGTITRHVHTIITADTPPAFPFLAITESWFATADDAVRSRADAAFAPLDAALSGFCDSDGVVTMLTHVTHRWPRDQPPT